MWSQSHGKRCQLIGEAMTIRLNVASRPGGASRWASFAATPRSHEGMIHFSIPWVTPPLGYRISDTEDEGTISVKVPVRRISTFRVETKGTRMRGIGKSSPTLTESVYLRRSLPHWIPSHNNYPRFVGCFSPSSTSISTFRYRDHGNGKAQFTEAFFAVRCTPSL